MPVYAQHPYASLINTSIQAYAFIYCIHIQFNRRKDAIFSKIRWRGRETSRGSSITEWWPAVEP
jgi:hypothetical protein